MRPRPRARSRSKGAYLAVVLVVAALLVLARAASHDRPDVVHAAGFTASAAVSPDAVAAGDVASIRVAVRNDTAVSARVTFAIADPAGGEVYRQAFANEPIGARARTFSLAWQVPASQPAGTYRVALQATSVDGAVTYLTKDDAAAVTVTAPRQLSLRCSRRTPCGTPTPAPTTAATPAPTGTPVTTATPSGAGLTVFDDALAGNWVNWSWAAGVNFGATSPVFAGSRAIAFTATAGWAGLYLHAGSAVDATPYTAVQFAAQASRGGQAYAVALFDGNDRQIATAKPLAGYGGDPVAGSWKTYRIPLADLGGAGHQIKGIVIQNWTDQAQPAVYVDELRLGTGATVATTATPSPAGTPKPTVTPTAAPTASPTGTAAPAATATPSATASPAPSPTPAPTAKSTLVLPSAWAGPLSDAAAAARVRAAAETRPDNAAANVRYPTAAELATFYSQDAWTNNGMSSASLAIQQRITGQPGRAMTTDELIQWAAWKWGIDEDVFRAVAATEGWWHQNTVGDWTTNQSWCPPGTWNGQGCNQSYSIIQMKWRYHGTHVWPLHTDSTPFALDYLGGLYRATFQGFVPWLTGPAASPGYAAYPATTTNDFWGVVGFWYSGGWYDGAALGYIGTVKTYLAQRVWEQPGF